jgi:hypothetical protein
MRGCGSFDATTGTSILISTWVDRRVFRGVFETNFTMYSIPPTAQELSYFTCAPGQPGTLDSTHPRSLQITMVIERRSVVYEEVLSEMTPSSVLCKSLCGRRAAWKLGWPTVWLAAPKLCQGCGRPGLFFFLISPQQDRVTSNPR